MEYLILALIAAIIAFALFHIFKFDQDAEAQRDLDNYLKASLSSVDIGRMYERYIGHLYELEGYDVEYHGAVNGVADMGRDLIVSNSDEVFVVQAKCWAKGKLIQENVIFQLFGSTEHFRLTSRMKRPITRAVLVTTANFSEEARRVAQVLGVELRAKALDRSYPMIKCCVSENGNKFYYLPFDAGYDTLKPITRKGGFFARTVREAVESGFRRSEKYNAAA